MSEQAITFEGRLAPGEKKWFGLTWPDELKGSPPTIPASTVQTADWEVIDGAAPLIIKVDQRHDDSATAVQVEAPEDCPVGKYIAKVVMVTDQGERHTRRCEIEVEIH